MSSYYELQIKINPDIEDIVSDICFENLPYEGVVLAEEEYKDLEMISTTEGTLRVFFLQKKADVEHILKNSENFLNHADLVMRNLAAGNFHTRKRKMKTGLKMERKMGCNPCF